LRQWERPGESGVEITDIGAICRTETILDALANRRPAPPAGNATRAGDTQSTAGEPDAGEQGARAPGVAHPGSHDQDARAPGVAHPGARELEAGGGAAEYSVYSAQASTAQGAEHAAAPRGDQALSVLAALAADVDEPARPSFGEDPWQDDAFLLQVRMACGGSRVPGTASAAAGRRVPGRPVHVGAASRSSRRCRSQGATLVTSWYAPMRNGVAVAAVTATAFCGGCRVSIRPQAIQELRSSLTPMMRCESCGRYLYWQE